MFVIVMAIAGKQDASSSQSKLRRYSVILLDNSWLGTYNNYYQLEG